MTPVPAARRRFALLIVVALCGSTPLLAKVKFTSSWSAPEAAGISFAGQKVAALVISRDHDLRLSAEEKLAAGLATRGIAAVPTYRIVPREEIETAERARGWFERSGVIGVVALRLVTVDRQVTYAPAVWTQPNYSTLWGWYGYGWIGAYDPGGVREDTTLVVETLIYSVPKDRLLWAGVSEATNPKSAKAFISDLIEAAVKEMKKKKLIK